ncbi:MAG: hypothetical protein JNM94_03920 [Phycisphaerae bacterium]|nr:hypothetical protein [Phycisphaerae bacterium]
MRSTRLLMTLVVAAAAVLPACNTVPPASAPPTKGPGTQTAGVPVKVTIPSQIAPGASFPIMIEFDGWERPGGPFELSYSDESLLDAPVRNHMATSKFTVVYARAASNVTDRRPLVVTAKANLRSKDSNAATVGSSRSAAESRSAALTVDLGPLTAGVPVKVELDDALPGELVTGTVEMKNFQSAGQVRFEYLGTEGVLVRAPQRWRASASVWKFQVRVRPNAAVDSVCIIGAYTKSDMSDIVWGTFTVR